MQHTGTYVYSRQAHFLWFFPVCIWGLPQLGLFARSNGQPVYLFTILVNCQHCSGPIGCCPGRRTCCSGTRSTAAGTGILPDAVHFFLEGYCCGGCAAGINGSRIGASYGSAGNSQTSTNAVSHCGHHRQDGEQDTDYQTEYFGSGHGLSFLLYSGLFSDRQQEFVGLSVGQPIYINTKSAKSGQPFWLFWKISYIFFQKRVDQ